MTDSHILVTTVLQFAHKKEATSLLGYNAILFVVTAIRSTHQDGGHFQHNLLWYELHFSSILSAMLHSKDQYTMGTAAV